MKVVPISQQHDAGLSFDDFWLLMVRKVAKHETRQLFERLSDEDKRAAMLGAAAWRPVWLDMEIQYVMHPDRWVRRHRWEDELPAAYRQRHASHVYMEQAGPAPRGPMPRAEMPESVRALVAKLKGQK